MPEKTKQDRFGFAFWLGWILYFIGSLTAVSVFWTWAISRVTGEISGNELTLTWCIAVFGSWFFLLIPFIRKKEQIWKRLNKDQEKATDVWLMTVAAFIGLLVASALFWSWYYRAAITAEHEGLLHPRWSKAVFGSWLFFLMPFLILMYRRTDQIFREATRRQLQRGPVFATAFVEKAKRTLPSRFKDKVAGFPETLKDGHIVRLSLKDGRTVSDVFIFRKSEILGIYGQSSMDFSAEDISDLEAVPANEITGYEEEKWLRLDGKA